ncbi:hypothetical protein LOAG_11571 [Loa loa]|uniref:Uncharacterized protein n=2 Tax=Loa loa TaxID=7209 RepID=A0A1S0TNB6_LOALO|nr:hypothetical protein LOAG_11571 [Loa loa]EFO16931.1 hypothetical protein LOAG_11571 [Loa loa]
MIIQLLLNENVMTVDDSSYFLTLHIANINKIALLLVFALLGYTNACFGGGYGDQTQCCCLKLPPICLPILNLGGCCGGCCCPGQGGGGGIGGGYALL